MNRLCALGERISNKLAWLPPLLARLTIGIVFAKTGWGKLHNLDQIREFFTELGIPAAHIQAPLVAGCEFVGGLLVLVGLATRVATLPLMGIMAVAILTAKREELLAPSALFGFEEWSYIVLLAGLAVLGPGRVSLDAVIARLWGQRARPSTAAPRVEAEPS